MLPFFANPDRPVVNVPAPAWFKPIRGAITDAQITGAMMKPALSGGAQMSIAKQNGLRYERIVQEYLQLLALKFEAVYLPEPGIRFRDNSGFRVCYPDGLFIRAASAVIVEIKIQHMPEAWWQLRKLYEPVVKILFPTTPTHVLEIVKTFDAAMPFPEEVDVVGNPENFLYIPNEKFGVSIWRQ